VSPQTHRGVHFAGHGRQHRTMAPAAALKPGQLLCPVCRNGARLRMDGFLRKHNDLFGHPCYNHRSES
jgi:hypothetical protein